MVSLQKPSIVVVCHGNTHRSPLAWVIIKWHLGQHYRVLSRGLSKDGVLASKKVRDYAESLGYDLSSHRSTKVTEKELREAQRVLYMDSGNLRRLKLISPETVAEKARCLATYVGEERIPDPAFMSVGSEKLGKTLNLIRRASVAFVRNTELRRGLKEKSPTD